MLRLKLTRTGYRSTMTYTKESIRKWENQLTRATVKNRAISMETVNESIRKGISPFVTALRLMKKLEVFLKLRWSTYANIITQESTANNALLAFGVNIDTPVPLIHVPEKYVELTVFVMTVNLGMENAIANVRDLIQKGFVEKIRTIETLRKSKRRSKR